MSKNDIEDIVDARIFPSHASLSKMLSDFGADIKKMADEITNLKIQVNVANVTLKSLAETNEKYVTEDQFWPVKTLVYGCLTLLLGAGVTYLLSNKVALSQIATLLH